MHWRIERLKNIIGSKFYNIANFARQSLWLAREKKYPRTQDGELLLHIGCGDINAPDFINIDARKYRHVHIVTRNIFRLWMIPDNTVDLIYMCHVLEHVPRKNISLVLKEMHRILKPKGKLRISVPDFDHIIAIYNDTNHQIEYISPSLMGGQDYPENFHHEVYNKKYLSNLLFSHNFGDITEWNPHESQFHNFEDWASKKLSFNNKEYLISLNLEASKVQ
ncbi:class I SAM-dependent methyltransferase [Methylomonas sp. HW2-6]|uniref:class I SAM-dependent methyltransferase n=1 Tax=Methylomonas sp. HW2-6 TaxID=3376687 RepID=UPI004041E6E5